VGIGDGEGKRLRGNEAGGVVMEVFNVGGVDK